MERQAVSSTNLRSVGYDPASQTLEIESYGGRIYQSVRWSSGNRISGIDGGAVARLLLSRAHS